MAETSTFLATKRYAVVTGANRGLGLEICRQLASNGIMVVITARDDKKGMEAVDNLRRAGGAHVSHLLYFHQLDVADPSTIASLANFINAQFGKLDILVNNAAISGVIADSDAIRTLVNADGGHGQVRIAWKEKSTQPYDLAEECLKTNYYGARNMIEALIPLLQLSDSPRIVNISSTSGKLKFIPNEWAKGVLNDDESLTEERIGEVLKEFLKDFKEGLLEAKGWPDFLSSYTLSKAAMNAYSRILAKRYPNLIINCVCPGFVNTELNCNTGILTVEEGAEGPVRLALLPKGGPSGRFFSQKEVSSF